MVSPPLRSTLVAVALLLSTTMAASAQPTVFFPAASDGATASSAIGGVCVGCTVENLDDVIGRRVDPATVSIPLGVLGTAAVRVDLASAETPNTRAGFVVAGDGAPLDLELIDRFTVRTYLGDAEQETATRSAGLIVNALANGRSKVTFRARAPYDAVEIEVAGAALLATALDVHHAIITRPRALDRIIALADDGATASGETSGLCLGCSVTDLAEAIDAPMATAADLSVPLGVAGAATLTVDYGSTLPAATWTGFWMSSNADLLDLTVLGRLTVEALDGTTVVGGASGADLRVTQRPDGVAYVRFRTGQAFDAVRIRAESLVGVSLELRVHQAMTVPVEDALAVGPDVAAASIAEARTASGVRLGAPRPNPASGAARVTLHADQAVPVRVAVVDVLGREVAVLHDGPARLGVTTLAVDGSSLAPGTYGIRAQSTVGPPVVRMVTVGR